MKTLLLLLFSCFYPMQFALASSPIILTPTLTISDERLEQLIQKIENIYAQDHIQFADTINYEKEYLAELDLAINERMSFYVDQSFAAIQKNLTPNTQPELQEIKNKYQDFQDSKKYFGTGKDFLRFNAFYAFNQSLRALLGSQAKPSWLQSLSRLMKQIYRGLVLLRPFFRLSFNTLFPTIDDKIGTPLTKSADKYFQKIAELDGITVATHGSLVPPAHGPQVINLILANHVSAKFDAIALSALNLDSYITFGALNLSGEGIFSIATHPAFKSVLKRIDQQRDIILLGREQDPIEKLKDVLKSGRTHNLFLFPQGMISLGFNETNPLKPSFSEKVIQELLNAGFKIRLQIMSMPDNFEETLKPQPSSEHGKNLRVNLSTPIEDQELRQILEKNGPAGMDLYIRMHWIRTLRQFHSEYLGVVGTSYLDTLTKVTGSKTCSKILTDTIY